jgi:(1->4)-alpha-D-glucan 1-alpha-D-glucosylmutase
MTGMVARAPASTYRLQLTADFDLFEAARRLPYLHDLGVDWVYLSPILAAEPGSEHGYDVVAHDRVDASRGGADGLTAFSAEAKRLGMGVLVDIVPNHVGVATPREMRWWWDVLQHGRGSEHAAAFDVDWDAGGGRLRLPVVGDDDVLPDGRIAHLQVVDGELRYHDNAYPLAPGTEGEDTDEVHARQHYELVCWRRADAELNYRRFFAVNTLAGVRVEDPEVLARSHAEIRRWFDEGLVDGLRVDHPDGLRDPQRYLDDLAELTGGAYVLVEKILEPGEELPTSWATAGTTGYDALAHVDRVLTDPSGQAALDTLEARLRGAPVDWVGLIHDRKRDVADGILQSEVRRIVREVVALAGDGPSTPTEDELRDGVAELLACFPVYRSYLPEGREHLDDAFAAARRHRPDLAGTLDLLEPVLADPSLDPAKRFQQTSGMVMAKGVEDCAFYRYSRLTSLNEVGGDPSIFAITPEEFHERMSGRQRDWPRAMTALSTHDTKRGEDVRARITALAELPDEWESTLDRLLELAPLPDPGFGSLLWQAVLGAWPASRKRLHDYAEKAMREAGDHTTWTEPDETYEKAVHSAVDAAFDDPQVIEVLDGLLQRVVAAGWSNGLAAKLLALTMPGVPDVYQGSELWEQSLVDPDNRRPIDMDLRARLLRSLRDGEPAPLTADVEDLGTAKLRVVRAALTLRRDRPELFSGYAALAASGAAADHVLGLDRGGVIAAVTRLPVGLTNRGGWGETTLQLAPGRWTPLLGGPGPLEGDARLAELMAELPVNLLVREDD